MTKLYREEEKRTYYNRPVRQPRVRQAEDITKVTPLLLTREQAKTDPRLVDDLFFEQRGKFCPVEGLEGAGADFVEGRWPHEDVLL